MCVKEKTEALKSWWRKSHFLQTQLVTVVTIIFATGAAYNALANVKVGLEENKEATKEVRSAQKPMSDLLHKIDKKADINEVRILRLEKEDHHGHTKSVNNQ
jgi:hypothetical protein